LLPRVEYGSVRRNKALVEERPLLTLFALPKPFQGQFGIIQRNAITSWTMLRPQPEIILFGDEPGTAEIAEELGVRCIPQVARNEFGTPLLHDVFCKAEKMAPAGAIAYVNADIMILSDFLYAVSLIERLGRDRQYLISGIRWNLKVEKVLSFGNGWEQDLRTRVKLSGKADVPSALDYFIFSRGLYRQMPPLAVGRTAWDNWLLYQARASKAMVVDASPAVMAIHQLHDYSHLPNGEHTAFRGAEAQLNQQMVRDAVRDDLWVFGLMDATHVLTGDGLKPVRKVRGLIPWLRWEANRFALFNPVVGLPVRLIKNIIRRFRRGRLT
jgi:hypothetical protein